MSIEIERRWLVEYPVIYHLGKPSQIDQHYLGNGYRVRKEVSPSGEIVFTKTIKTTINHVANEEHEEIIDKAEYERLMKTSTRRIAKNRYRIDHEGLVIELDQIFLMGSNVVWIAEVELETEDQEFTIPLWFGKEITGDKSYSNYSLASMTTPPVFKGVWTEDCSSKKDYDGPMVDLSCRTYPPTLTYPERIPYPATGSATIRLVESLYLSGLHDRDTFVNEAIDLATASFEAPTQEEVNRLVEIWANEQYARISKALKLEFKK